MWIMAFTTIIKLGIMRGKIDLGDYTHRPGRIDLMASTTELPPAMLLDIVHTGILGMLEPGPVTDQARQSGMQVIGHHGLNVVMTIIAGLFTGMDHFLGGYIFKCISTVMSVFPETLRNQEMTNEKE